MRLAGKTAVITGAARGLGRACAIAFAREGATLGLIDVCADIDGCPYPMATRSQLLATAVECRAAGASVLELECDVRDSQRVDECIARVRERYNAVDVLVNNAGIVAPSGKPVQDVQDKEWSLMLEINLFGAWRMLRAVLPAMIEQRSGSVVNIASTAGLIGYRHFATYVVSKHGLVGLTRVAALECAALGVRINALCPGSVRDAPAMEGRMLSEIARVLDVPLEEHERLFSESQPSQRLVEADAVAASALWLATDEAISVTGAIIPVDGGFTAQ